MLDTRRRAGTVIKVGNAGPILKSLSHVDLADHLSQAREIVATAKKQAAKTVTDATEESRRRAAEAKESARDQGYKDGFAKGEIAGHEKAFEESIKIFEARHATVVKQMINAIGEIEAIKDGLRVAAERDLLEFAAELAFGLTYRIGLHSSQAAIENANRAMRLVGKRTDLSIRINPKDLKAMETYASTVMKRMEASPNITALADESMAPGGCIVETNRTRIDASLETQIAELSLLLLGEDTEERPAACGGTPVNTNKDSDTPR